ncbi:MULTISPECIES: hydrolytic protein [unclassified Streptomyces]|uniref:COG1470 family protein n=1 Tax=unclassified Streptomyces TaxID=2593676 RepID=UPI0011E63A66|nr:hydrolytic protein [Streptomyces sp. sk2.1]TXS79558.1 hydrolytic protein [Streptomyces sp. sk2.1]
MSTVTVSPGAEATTTLTVRNDGDIVEAYTLEVVGDCAAWSTVEPARVSLYPGTSEVVTVRLAPPRSHEVRAGETPLGVRVLPAERPESVAVPESTVVVEPFHELRGQLDPRRRRGWRGARFQTSVQNRGNTPVGVVFTGTQDGEELRLAFSPDQRRLEPGESAEVGLRVRAQKLIWFGTPATWPFEVEVAEKTEGEAEDEQPHRPETLSGEFAQIPILPRWLLIVLAALLALLLAWFALVRPAVKSTAEQAVTDAAEKERRGDGQQGGASSGGSGDASGGQGQDGNQKPRPGRSSGGSGGSGSTSGTGGDGHQQMSETIDVQVGAGGTKKEPYRVPEGKVFGVTDLVVANFQGDEGVLTITFGNRKITTIALETFRNQDYHWVTPIEIPENETVTASVTCNKPGTPATGTQAAGCHQVLNVSGILRDLEP